MSADSAWVGLAGALGGVALTGLIGLVTAGLNRRWGQKDQVTQRKYDRDQATSAVRRDAYVRYLASVQSAVETLTNAAWDPELESEEQLSALRRANPDPFDETDAAKRQAELVASEPVVRAIREYDDWVVLHAVMKVAGRDKTALKTWPEVEYTLIDTMRADIAEAQEPTGGSSAQM